MGCDTTDDGSCNTADHATHNAAHHHVLCPVRVGSLVFFFFFLLMILLKRERERAIEYLGEGEHGAVGDGVGTEDVVVDDVVHLFSRLSQEFGRHLIHFGHGDEILLEQTHSIVRLLDHHLVYFEGLQVCAVVFIAIIQSFFLLEGT